VKAESRLRSTYGMILKAGTQAEMNPIGRQEEISDAPAGKAEDNKKLKSTKHKSSIPHIPFQREALTEETLVYQGRTRPGKRSVEPGSSDHG
jgi:hypothetical protein